ncbi:hypothetical protein PsorP6_003488 [Peronosclerospora sorghi]|uniref:Uncharacterized protein n=1 Tax=Peronosclerospora sorghi TaxID=230839 RepID=A0ACC0VKH2_9STRA|nr:hypothetical protein PsorP6_003488 [Peronosclerospora sorghi]
MLHLGKSGSAAVEEIVDLTKVVPTNILKDGVHPDLKERSEYTESLYTILDPKLTLGELERMGFDILKMEDQHRFLGLLNRQAIKESNADKEKK